MALLVFTALGTTLVSAVGADSISLGASGMAFGMLGASVTFGWRRAGGGADRVSYSNGLTGEFRSSATLLQASCHGRACVCDRVVRSAVEGDLWRLAEVGALKKLHLGEVSALRTSGSRLDGLLEGEEGQAKLSAVCLQREEGPVALVVLQPAGGSASLVERMAVTISWPAKKSFEAAASR